MATECNRFFTYRRRYQCLGAPQPCWETLLNLYVGSRIRNVSGGDGSGPRSRKSRFGHGRRSRKARFGHGFGVWRSRKVSGGRFRKVSGGDGSGRRSRKVSGGDGSGPRSRKSRFGHGFGVARSQFSHEFVTSKSGVLTGTSHIFRVS